MLLGDTAAGGLAQAAAPVPGSVAAPLFQELTNALAAVRHGKTGTLVERSQGSRRSPLILMPPAEGFRALAALLIVAGVGLLAFVLALSALPRLAAAGFISLSPSAHRQLQQSAFVFAAAVVVSVILGLLISRAVV
ncbi:MAG: hypothetical protein ICV59_04205 [Thermoleophilia bacterium]|nr:hypothetical protein [Thermoleophilia bacterium]